jgi:hypothetical protein
MAPSDRTARTDRTDHAELAERALSRLRTSWRSRHGTF